MDWLKPELQHFTSSTSVVATLHRFYSQFVRDKVIANYTIVKTADGVDIFIQPALSVSDICLSLSIREEGVNFADILASEKEILKVSLPCIETNQTLEPIGS